ncbi:MAG: beta-phosphoglucomutase family hydrolase [Actinomycetota bacterium]|nr:beta-phosphoglucomutase family hydrolase [Actinomycetota bacterium]
MDQRAPDGSAELALEGLDAVVFDLDGVVTDTAVVHARAWKETFDEFLARRAQELGEPFEPFDAGADYARYVDGKPRFDGVESFLASRGISLPFGDPADPGDRRTVCGLGNRKNALFERRLEEDGVEPFPSTVRLIEELREAGIATAIISSSRNCVPVLQAAGLRDVFDEKVDGVDAAALGLPGKPHPAVFLEAARRLGIDVGRTAVVEDALAGVEAGRRGGFKVVIGVDRAGQAQALAEHGADLVVRDLGELRLVPTAPRVGPDPWQLVYEGFEPDQEGLREALCTLGNGYFATRGAAPEADADDVHYPGTYAAGCFNRLHTDIAGRTIENEDMVNLPNWLVLRFRTPDGSWFDPAKADLLDYRQAVDLRRGVLTRDLRFRDAEGRVTRVTHSRLVHMDNPHLAGLETTFTAENWSGVLHVVSGLDGGVTNSGIKRYRALAHHHLKVLQTAGDGESIHLVAETSQSHIRVGLAARTRVLGDGEPVSHERRLVDEPAFVAHDLAIDLQQGRPVTVEKVVALFTSRDRAIFEAGAESAKAVSRAGGFSALLRDHEAAWQRLWRRCRLEATGQPRAELVLNLHVFHLLQTVSEHTIGLDVGVPARGLHGEAYRGHIFWDELFIFPFLNLRLPELTRSLLLYRYRRMNEARWAARQAGYAGAMFPWQSGSDGREESQVVHLNPRSGRWVPDHSNLQRHISVAVAYNVWQYFQVTDDREFLYSYGAEMLIEIARFWASIATFNRSRERYEIRGVVGPDEYHDAYPDADTPGLDNNAYTNVMAVWVLRRAIEALDALPPPRRRELTQALALRPSEVDRWKDISHRMYVPFHGDGIISQFEGYERLEEFDWEGHRQTHGDIQRLDRILEAEGDTPNRYQVSKQADTLMLFFLLTAEELAQLFERLGYPFDQDTIPRTVDYYLQRTSHGSTLSRVVHSWVLARSDRERSWEFFAEALESDISDIQGGTAAEGIHLGAMAGTVDLVQRCYTGLELLKEELRLNPVLPEELSGLDFSMRWQGHWGITMRITGEEIMVRLPADSQVALKARVRDELIEVQPGQAVTVRL